MGAVWGDGCGPPWLPDSGGVYGKSVRPRLTGTKQTFTELRYTHNKSFIFIFDTSNSLTLVWTLVLHAFLAWLCLWYFNFFPQFKKKMHQAFSNWGSVERLWAVSVLPAVDGNQFGESCRNSHGVVKPSAAQSEIQWRFSQNSLSSLNKIYNIKKYIILHKSVVYVGTDSVSQ